MKLEVGEYHKIPLKEYKKAYREVRKEEEKMGFLVHLVVYMLVNGMLIVINLLYSSNTIWFFYPLMGWGIGLSMHYLFGILWLEKTLKEREAKAEYREKIWSDKLFPKIIIINVLVTMDYICCINYSFMLYKNIK